MFFPLQAERGELDPTQTPALPLARPEAAAPPSVGALPGPLPSSAAAPADDPVAARAVAPLTPAGSLILQTALFGPPTVSDGAGRGALYATRSRGDGRGRAYRSVWRNFSREPLAADPGTTAMYVVRCADQGFAVSSIRVHLAAIRTAHLLAGLSLDLPILALLRALARRRARHRPRRG